MSAQERIKLIAALVELLKIYPSMSAEMLAETESVIQAQYKFLRS